MYGVTKVKPTVTSQEELNKYEVFINEHDTEMDDEF